MKRNMQLATTPNNKNNSNTTHTQHPMSDQQDKNETREELRKETSVNSMDVSSSIPLSMNIFTSPPQPLHNTSNKQQPKTPAQKRRQRRYNLRKYKSTSQQNNFNPTKVHESTKRKTTSKPLCPSKTIKSTTISTTTEQQLHVPSKPENKVKKSAENEQTHNTVRVVDFITESNSIDQYGKIQGLLVTSEPTSTFSPNYTLNYVSVDEELVNKFIHYTPNSTTYLKNQYLEIDDAVIFLNEILFQFTEYGTGTKWYYCHYLDIDYHGNVILLQASDTPQTLIHQFNVKNSITPQTECPCKICNKSKQQDGKPIGYFTPCYIHKHKHNRIHYHQDDHIKLIKLIQRICFRHNSKEQRLVHNPIIGIEKVDEKRNLYCSTILPTISTQLTLETTHFGLLNEDDAVSGLRGTSMHLPIMVQGDTCNKEHHKTIAYGDYSNGFICDRCGYGYNIFDLLYRCDDSDNNEDANCEERDLCCKCAIKLTDARNQDADLCTQQDNIYKLNNVPMLTTQFLHQGKKMKQILSYRPTSNYIFTAAPSNASITDTDNEQVIDINHIQPLQVPTAATNTTELLSPNNRDTTSILHTTIPTTQAPSIDMAETDDEDDSQDLSNDKSQVISLNNNNTQPIIQPQISTEHQEQPDTKSNNNEQIPISTVPLQQSQANSLHSQNKPTKTNRLKRSLPPSDDQPAEKRSRIFTKRTTQTTTDLQDCTNCHNTYTNNKLWTCQNRFECDKKWCIDCLINKGYSKYYMLNCTKHWFCNECLETNRLTIQEEQRKQARQHHHHQKPKKYRKAPFQNKLNCNLSQCIQASSIYATQRRLQLHSLENGWEVHQNMPVWQYWNIKPCLYCLNKYTMHMAYIKQHQHSTATYTARDVNWIQMDKENNLCTRCEAETNNDPEKCLERLEQNNLWSNQDTEIDITNVDNLINDKKNYIAALLKQDTYQQMYETSESTTLPSLLEIKSIMIEQVDKLPSDMLGRIKILLNKVLWNINNVDTNNLDAQLQHLQQLMMIWKIISQKRVRSNSTYSGYTKRSDMDYTLTLLEHDKWIDAWNNMIINKITRNLKRTPALTSFNELLHNIYEHKGLFDYGDHQMHNNLEQEQISDDVDTDDEYKDEEKQDMPAQTTGETITAVHASVSHTIHTQPIHLHPPHVQREPIHNTQQDRFNKNRSQYLATQGKYKKAIDALESNGLCPNTIEYRELFRSKLEPSKGDIVRPQIHINNNNKFHFNHQQVSHVARSMDHTSGAGVDGMKIKYLKQLTNDTNDIPELINNITIFMTNMANGELPPVIAKHLRHSRAISGKKIKRKYENDKPIKYDEIHDCYVENNHSIHIDIRPITIQMGWIRLCNRIIFNTNRKLTRKLCLDKQVGIGCPSGAQALIAAAKIGIDIIKQKPQKAMMKLDFRNCYNTIDRQKLINIISRLAPELSGLYFQRYNSSYRLVHSDGTYDLFENGVAQGCNLSTAALGAIQKDAEPKIIQNCKNIKNNWKLDISGKYHDDGTDVADIEDLHLYYQESCKIYHEYGMEFQPHKSELIINRNVDVNTLPVAFQSFQISIEKVNILGVPIGDDDYIDEQVILKLIQARKKLNTIHTFNNDKVCTDMVRKFNGTSKLMYLFSNLEFDNTEREYKKELWKLDQDKIKTAVETTLTDVQRQQLELPVKLAGIGIGGMTDMVSAMVLSNYINIKDKIQLFIADTTLLQTGIQFLEDNVKLALMDYQQRLQKYGTCTCKQDTCKECFLKHIHFDQFLIHRIGLNQTKPITFKYLMNVMNQLKLKNVYAQSTPQHRIVLNQLINSNLAHKYILAEGFSSKLNNAEWHYNMMRRIGKVITSEPLYCPYCKDHPLMDPYGNHASSCPTRSHRINRHDRIKNAIAQLCKDANIRHRVEPKDLTESKRRPADVLIYGIGSHGLALDVGITDSITRFISDLENPKRKESNTNGYYAGQYYQQKVEHFHEAKFTFGYEMLQPAPIIIENFGYMDPRSLLMLNKLITLAARNMHKPRSDVDYIIKTKISTILARSEARAGLARYYYTYDNSYCRF